MITVRKTSRWTAFCKKYIHRASRKRQSAPIHAHLPWEAFRDCGLLNIKSFRNDILFNSNDLKELSSIANVLGLFISCSRTPGTFDPLKSHERDEYIEKNAEIHGKGCETSCCVMEWRSTQ